VQGDIFIAKPMRGKSGMSAPARGVKAPDFTFVAEDGTEYHLRDLAGHPIVLNFWATWCPPCRAEMPALDAAYKANKAKGLIILAVNEMDGRERVAQFRQIMDLNLPMVLDTQGTVGKAYRVQGLPTSFFLSTDGVVALRWTGMLNDTVLQKGLDLIMGP